MISTLGCSGKLGSDALDVLAVDQDIGLRRLMDVAIMLVDPPAADQNARDLSSAGRHFILLLTSLPTLGALARHIMPRREFCDSVPRR